MEWEFSARDVNIPGYPEWIFSTVASNGAPVEVCLEPVNGYDDGELHEDNLRFFVNVYRYATYDEENQEWIDSYLSRSSTSMDDFGKALCRLLKLAAEVANE